MTLRSKVFDWAAIGWTIAGPVAKRIGGRVYDRYLKYTIRRDIRAGSGTKIGILIARLPGDTPDNSCRRTLWDTIRDELGDAVELTNWPDEFLLGEGHESDIERVAHATAQKLLTDHNADLLISGRIKGQAAGKAVLSLRFTVAEADAENPRNYPLTETFDLPVDFVTHLGAAIAARVIVGAAPAIHMAGRYIVPLMTAAAERLEPIARRRNKQFDADTRGSLLFNYALVQSTIGEQAGSNEALIQAAAAFRAALLEWTRERVPLQWATTQNNLGNALRTLGERESGTARLEQAVAAFRAALLEWTRERVPLQWATTQNNLGTALAILGDREIGTARLEQAVAAFRAALEVFEAAKASHYIDGTRRNLARAETLLAQRQAP
jgi:tetratricopeptide (TPR) repeat protein